MLVQLHTFVLTHNASKKIKVLTSPYYSLTQEDTENLMKAGWSIQSVETNAIHSIAEYRQAIAALVKDGEDQTKLYIGAEGWEAWLNG
jgi:hypothetical protein